MPTQKTYEHPVPKETRISRKNPAAQIHPYYPTIFYSKVSGTQAWAKATHRSSPADSNGLTISETNRLRSEMALRVGSAGYLPPRTPG